MSTIFSAEAQQAADILEYVDKYCDDCGYDSGYAELQLQDLDYIAREFEVDFDYLVALLRENF